VDRDPVGIATLHGWIPGFAVIQGVACDLGDTGYGYSLEIQAAIIKASYL
jgi:hypothetical protein